jgi:pyrimidine operon attenuation protein / uracil phosphoribosyltransferase
LELKEGAFLSLLLFFPQRVRSFISGIFNLQAVMYSPKVRILEKAAIHARIRRMAYEIYEANYSESEVIIIGIDERGGFLADELCRHLREISPLQIISAGAYVDRSDAPQSVGIDLSLEISELRDKSVIVVDDVLYTGFTLLHVVSILLQAFPRRMHTAVLIDRGHRNLPVSSDFVGLELATTIQQHVVVEIDVESGDAAAFLVD